MKAQSVLALIGCLTLWSTAAAERIDRHALVVRHNPVLETIDPAAPLMLGNGNIGFTADITGLQTFPERYAPLSPLLTEAQWAWHSFPNPHHYTAKDTLVPVDIRGKPQYYPYMKSWSDGDTNPALNWIRENPHRFSLGRVALDLRDRTGAPAAFSDISQTRQTLDMWTGVLTSRFVYDGEAVLVKTYVHSTRDIIVVEVSSALVSQGRLAVSVTFPGVSPLLNPDPSDWTHPESHRTSEISRKPGVLSLKRQLDDTHYFVTLKSAPNAAITLTGPHRYRIAAEAGSGSLRVMAAFSPEPQKPLPGAAAARRSVAAHWAEYWMTGGVVDFSGSSDPRAAELERRVVLSQYLMAINGAGTIPPQEEGLFSNSWNGKFHLEMHPWHSAHFALWGRSRYLARSMSWYTDHLADAEARARDHGLVGAWWPKMAGPDGVDSPSVVSPFIMWQQPHPIYMAELLYRADYGAQTLARYGRMVEQTADLLASFLHRDAQSGRYVLGPPVIPVQENWNPMTTFDPVFELAYFRWGIETAQAWRLRAGKPRRADWDDVLKAMAPLPQKDGVYLPTGSDPGFWETAESEGCRGHADVPICMNRDHPSFLMALGWLPGKDVDAAVMNRTLDKVTRDWDMRQTWGWDYPMLAMTAARLHRPEAAVDWLFFDAKNNQFGTSGMTPRVHLDAHAATFVPGVAQTADGQDGVGYRRAAETYFPSNGGLLMAVAMMAAGWDGERSHAPGFPKKGWVVRTEGLSPAP